LRGVEEIIDPQLEICDPHHHLWDLADPTSAFLSQMPIKHYLLTQLLADLKAGHNVTSTVYIEAGAFYRADCPAMLAPVGETEFANGIAAMGASGRYGQARPCDGIVARADLSVGAEVEAILEAHRRVAGDRLKGIRFTSAVDPSGAVPLASAGANRHLYANDSFRDGFGRLAQFGLTFDAWLYHVDIADLTDLAHAFPNQPIVIDHLATPIGIGHYAARRDEVFIEWRDALRELARCPNVSAKLGGFGMFMLGFDLPDRHSVSSAQLADAWRPYLETAIEAFGDHRCMFESNFPVDSYACDYRTLWNAFKRIASGCTPEVKRRLFCENAVAFYGLSSATHATPALVTPDR
jgi:L-fuconolactonase